MFLGLIPADSNSLGGSNSAMPKVKPSLPTAVNRQEAPNVSCSAYLNNADLIAPFSITQHKELISCGNEPPSSASASASASPLNQEVFQVLNEIVPSFLIRYGDDACKPQDLIIRNLTGGLTNLLLTVTLAPSPNGEGSNSEDTLLLRLYGEEEDASEGPSSLTSLQSSPSTSTSSSLFNRQLENQISAELSLAGIAPCYFGQFSNGRIEQFYKGTRPLSYQEMADERYTGAIATQLARLHQVELSCLSNEKNESNGQGQIWKRIKDWIELAKGLNSEREKWIGGNGQNDKKLGEQVEAVASMLAELQSEWEWLTSELCYSELEKDTKEDYSIEEIRAIEFCRELVFAHTDCQSLNILTAIDGDQKCDGSTTENVRLIDFEYAGINKRAVDLGNTFAEFCDMNNLAADYKNQYPTVPVQNMFLRAYIQEYDGDLFKELECMNEEIFLSTMRDEIGKHSLLSHLVWASWALVKSFSNSIEFDYMQYAMLRVQGYRFFKSQYWPDMTSRYEE